MMEQQKMYLQNPDPQTGLEGSMWKLELAGGDSGAEYPERPDEPDCMYYMRTGTCRYGDKCRFNHPRDRVAPMTGVTRSGEKYPERLGQPICQYFLKTGTCKFGATCKYHHPKQGDLITINIHGYPLRPGEKECSYYVKTGQCKFGVACIFHHPQPVAYSVPPATPSFYSAVQSPSVPSPQSYSTTSWPVARPEFLPGSYMQGGHGSLVFSPGFVPVSGWSPYPPPASSVFSPGGQHTAQPSSMYGAAQQQLSASAPAYLGSYPLVSSSAGLSSSSKKEQNFPERPDQPECQFYMRTGDCKFGPTCKYHHPPEWSFPKTACTLSPIGLPLRQGAPSCAFYSQYGVCKFGPTCKFDHPMGMLNYSPSASSLTDMPVAPHPVGYSIATLAPSTSSELWPESFSAPSNSEPFSTRLHLSGHSSSGSTGSIFSHSFVTNAFNQSSTCFSGSSTVVQGDEANGSS